VWQSNRKLLLLTSLSANRLFVHKTVVETFTKKLVAKVAALKTGAGLEKSTTQGPLVNKAAVQKVAEHVENAVNQGAKVELGGTLGSGNGFFISQLSCLVSQTQC
jgi:succinate-semialdehyde dehydrogenase / glutarate-semialdehyde dehydrogenase